MMIEIETRIAESMHARADRPVRVEDLRAGAVRRARVIRRRRVAGAAGGAGLVAALTAAVAAGPWLAFGEDGSGPATTGAAPDPVVVFSRTTTLPGAAAPAAADQPAAVGTDPAILHFDVDVEALGARITDWRSGPGYEGVTVRGTEDSPAIDLYIGSNATALEAGRPHPGSYVELSDGTSIPLYDFGEPEETTVDGRPATLREVTGSQEKLDELEDAEAGSISRTSLWLNGNAWVLSWQPVDGLHAIAQVHGGDRAAVHAAAAALRLDRAQRCAVPLRLEAVPVGAQWTECRTSVRHDPTDDRVTWALSSLTLGLPAGDPLVIFAEDSALATHPSDPPIEPNRTVAGYPAWWSTEAPAGLFVPAFGPASVFVEASEEQASWLVERLSFAGEVDQPGGWPLRAVG